MTEFFLIFLLSLVVFYVDYRRTSWNMDRPHNGHGSLGLVLSGRALQPMQYRVLVPYIWRMFSCYVEGRLLYAGIKYIGVLFALYASYLWLGSAVGVLAMALFLCMTALYDYADGYFEVGFFALAFYCIGLGTIGSLWVLLLVMFLASLNRETSVFIPVALFLSGEWLVGGVCLFVFAWGYLLPRAKYGGKDRYCSLVMVKENIRRIKQIPAWPQSAEYLLFFLFMVVVGALVLLAWPLSGVELAMVLMVGGLLVPTVWAEMRVFQPAMLALIPMAMRGLV